jgi:RNA polymerase sigma-70 factor, ECF subfamily
MNGAQTDSTDWVPGDRDDFDRLYRQTWGKIVASLTLLLGDRAAAEDCAQETYRKAWTAWPGWKPDAPPEAWLHRIAVRVASNYRARERLRSAGETIRRLGRPQEIPDPAAAVEHADVERALRTLPVKQAALLVMRHVHGYTNRELAAAFNIPERTVASRLIAARRRMAQALGPDWTPKPRR